MSEGMFGPSRLNVPQIDTERLIASMVVGLNSAVAHGFARCTPMLISGYERSVIRIAKGTRCPAVVQNGFSEWARAVVTARTGLGRTLLERADSMSNRITRANRRAILSFRRYSI
jgi:hypothetical protein